MLVFPHFSSLVGHLIAARLGGGLRLLDTRGIAAVALLGLNRRVDDDDARPAPASNAGDTPFLAHESPLSSSGPPPPNDDTGQRAAADAEPYTLFFLRMNQQSTVDHLRC